MIARIRHRWIVSWLVLVLVFAGVPVVAQEASAPATLYLPQISAGDRSDVAEPVTPPTAVPPVDAGQPSHPHQDGEPADVTPANQQAAAPPRPVNRQVEQPAMPDRLVDIDPFDDEVQDEVEAEAAPEPEDAGYEEADAAQPGDIAAYDVVGPWRVSGRLGVGTATPLHSAHIVSNSDATTGMVMSNTSAGVNANIRLQLDTRGSSQGLEIRKFGANYSGSWNGIPLGNWARIRTLPNANGLLFTTGGSDPLVFGTNNVERVRLTSGGRLGIGTSNPDAKVHVDAGSANGVQSTSTGSYAVQAVNMSTIGARDGLRASTSARAGHAVWAQALAGTGTTTGVMAYNASVSGTAVYAFSAPSSGNTFGVQSHVISPDGIGVYGVHQASTGTTPGVYGLTYSSADYAAGVLGEVHSPSPGVEAAAVRGINNGTTGSGIGVYGSHAGGGYGVLGTIYGENGTGIYGLANNTSGNSYAGQFVNSSPDGIGVLISAIGEGPLEPALRVSNSGNTSGVATYMDNDSADATAYFSNTGSGRVLHLTNGGASGDGAGGGDFIQALSEDETDMQFRVAANGDVFVDGGYTGGGADYADMLAVAGDASSYEPGDVLLLGANGQLTVSAAPDSPAVVGVYSTDPAMTGDPLGLWQDDALPSADRAMLETLAADRVPVAMAGIVPVKVTAENGEILPGDLLTTSSTPGHAMKSTRFVRGSIIGKAMTALDAGQGVVQMLVMMQ